jgi:hypothetical protein
MTKGIFVSSYEGTVLDVRDMMKYGANPSF